MQTRSAAEFVSFAKACSGKCRHATAGNGGVVRGFRPAVPDSRIRMVRTCPLATGAAEKFADAGLEYRHVFGLADLGLA